MVPAIFRCRPPAIQIDKNISVWITAFFAHESTRLDNIQDKTVGKAIGFCFIVRSGSIEVHLKAKLSILD